MSYYCDTCDRTIKLRSKKKHLNTNLHRTYSNCIRNRYYIKNPEFFQIENILNKHISDYLKRFEFFIIICEWKIVFEQTTISVKSDRYSIQVPWDLRRFLLEKISNFERMGYKFSNISDMKISFIALLRNMTYEHYLQRPKSILEWTLIKKLARNPSLIKKFTNSSHPLVRKYKNMFPDDEGEDQDQ